MHAPVSRDRLYSELMRHSTTHVSLTAGTPAVLFSFLTHRICGGYEQAPCLIANTIVLILFENHLNSIGDEDATVCGNNKSCSGERNAESHRVGICSVDSFQNLQNKFLMRLQVIQNCIYHILGCSKSSSEYTMNLGRVRCCEMHRSLFRNPAMSIRNMIVVGSVHQRNNELNFTIKSNTAKCSGAGMFPIFRCFSFLHTLK